MTFTRSPNPVLFVGIYDGSTHSPSNPGSVRGDYLSNPDAFLAAIEDEADYFGCNSICLLWPVGALVGSAPPVAWWGIMQNTAAYNGLYDFWYNRFPALKRPTRRYGFYLGGRQDRPPTQTGYPTVADAGDRTSSPPAAFYADAARPMREVLGMDDVWIDALGAEPENRALWDDARPALESVGLRAGTELWPHDGIIQPNGGGFVIDTAAALVSPYMMLADMWGVVRTGQVGGNLFRGRLTPAPAASELHIVPQPGDNLVTADTIDNWYAANYVVSPWYGYRTNNPGPAAHLAARIKARRGRSAVKAANYAR